MSTYNNDQLAARFAALAPKPLPGDWEDVRGKATAPRRSGRRRLLMIGVPAVAVATAVALALFVSSPWQNAPGFLERAEAALTPPAGTILHYKVETSLTSTKFGCTVTGPDEMWIDQTPPHSWRHVTAFYIDPTWATTASSRTLACSGWGTHELGGSRDTSEMVEFVSPDKLVVSRTARIWDGTTPDPVVEIRTRITEAAQGDVQHVGTTEIDGRVVEHYRLAHPTACGGMLCPGASDLYMDSETFLPVLWDIPSALTIVPDFKRILRFDMKIRYLTIEYLPRTPENLALTDIKAQHPNAKGP